MPISLSDDELEVLLTCIQYSKRQVGDAQGTPVSVRQENLAKLERVEKKLRDAKVGH